MELEFEADIYESIFKEEPVQVLNAGKIYCACEDSPMVMFRKLDVEDWNIMPKKEFLKKYHKVSNDYD